MIGERGETKYMAKEFSSSDCYTLSNGRWVDKVIPRMLKSRSRAASSWTKKGLFVTGIFQGCSRTQIKIKVYDQQNMFILKEFFNAPSQNGKPTYLIPSTYHSPILSMTDMRLFVMIIR